MVKNNTLFRNPNYGGDNITDAVQIMLFEILELGNTDILETMLNNGFIKNETLRQRIEHAVVYISENGGPGYYDEYHYTAYDSDIKKMIQSLPNEIEKTTGKKIRFALWLASRDSVIKNYEGNDDNMLAYPTGDIVLSDLGDDGILFGYENEPKPVETHRLVSAGKV